MVANGAGGTTPTRLRDVRSIDGLRSIDRDDLTVEFDLITLAFFTAVLHHVLGPMLSAADGTLAAAHLWSSRAAVLLVVLAFGVGVYRMVDGLL